MNKYQKQHQALTQNHNKCQICKIILKNKNNLILIPIKI